MSQMIHGYGPAPMNEPLSYPGKHPRLSFLFRGTDKVVLCPQPGHRLEESLVGCRVGSPELRDICDISERYMVVVYGSNPNPAQLESKFGGKSVTIPIIKGTLTGCDVVYAPFISPYGAIPATLCESEGTEVNVWAMLVDDAQLRIMDRSEGRGTDYQLVRMDRSILLRNGEYFGPVYTYVCAAGTLMLDGAPVRLGAIRATGAKYNGSAEPEVLWRVWRVFNPEKQRSTTLKALFETRYNRNAYNRRLAACHSGPGGLEYAELDTGMPPDKIRAMHRSFWRPSLPTHNPV